MSQAGNVRFIRVRGRIIPLRGDGGGAKKGGAGKARTSGVAKPAGGGRMKLTALQKSERKAQAQQETVAKFVNIQRGAIIGGIAAVAPHRHRDITSQVGFFSRAKDLTSRQKEYAKRVTDFEGWAKVKKASPNSFFTGDVTMGYEEAKSRFARFAAGRPTPGQKVLGGTVARGAKGTAENYWKSGLHKGAQGEKFLDKFIDYQRRVNALESRTLDAQRVQHNIQYLTNRHAFRGATYAKRALTGAAIGAAAVGGYYYWQSRQAKKNRKLNKKPYA